MTTFGYQIPAAGTRWAQVDAEPRSAGFGHKAEIVVAADVASFLRTSQRLLAKAAFDASSLDERTAANAVDREAFEAAAVVDTQPWAGRGVHPGRVMATLARVLPQDVILTTDLSDLGEWTARSYRFNRPGTFLGSSAGPVGYGFAAAIAATLTRPGRLAVALIGEGGFATAMAEMETAVRDRAHVLAIVFDRGIAGLSWRSRQGDDSQSGGGVRAVDFAAVAEACGALGLSVGSDDEFEAALQQAVQAGRPALLHLDVDPRWSTPDGGTPDPGELLEDSVEPAMIAEEAYEATAEIVQAAEVDAVEVVDGR
jgi:acetolactate synthase-1/2/3 large subunit